MTAERAVEILTPGKTHFSPREYEAALELAREALQYFAEYSNASEMLRLRERGKEGEQ